MKIEKAIQLAVENGWNSEECQVPIGGRGRFNYDRMYLDPEFWKCLGKSLGWMEELNVKDYDTLVYQYWKWRPEWEFQWHRFINDIVAGRTPKDYFSKL